jgi:hypothetical protein
MNRNSVGSIYGQFSIKIAHFIPIHLQTLPPQAILVSDWLIFKILYFGNDQYLLVLQILENSGRYWDVNIYNGVSEEKLF